MTTILVAGGNSGIGLEASRRLLESGATLVLIGRSAVKGQNALSSFGHSANRARFIAADLSSHAGVVGTATRLLADYDQFDALVHTTGVLAIDNPRTADGLNAMFAVNYLSRYHLTQLLLPALRRAPQPRVLMMTAKVAMNTNIQPEHFPLFNDFRFTRDSPQINAANLHYAARLAELEPRFKVGVINAGTARTDIMRAAPGFMQLLGRIAEPLVYNSVPESASNLVKAVLSSDWVTPTYWGRPGKFDNRTKITVDPKITEQVMRQSHELASV
ncbi:SDR family NAD(P)-dependent oxidoreductase [Devosia epidermidihirudinis]|uniref:SDR family NAD(P)-dependent oxidoreductase n=1 Tax=Devosia epidermidihirudinis TaxID=1293439 RepID=UPI0006982D60|nr:SDR family NAD(P)-dependent oxidoreductase [Devosia epidermidihirudinis]